MREEKEEASTFGRFHPYSLFHREGAFHIRPPQPPCPDCAKNESNSLRQQLLLKNTEIQAEKYKAHINLLETLCKIQQSALERYVSEDEKAQKKKEEKKEEREKVSEKLYRHLVSEDEWGCITGGAIGSKWTEEKEKAGEEKKE